MKTTIKGWNRAVLSVAVNAFQDRNGEAHVASPEDRKAAKWLEARGLVEVRRTNEKCGGYPEWWVRITAKGLQAFTFGDV